MSVADQIAQRRDPAAETAADRPLTLRPVLGIFLWSRGAIWIAAIFAFLVFQPNQNPAAPALDAPFLHDLGYVTDIWARSDSKWYVGIAEHGYDYSPAAPAFFPLYPFSVFVLGHALFGHFVLAGVLISLAACLVAFALLYRIAEDKLGSDGARRAVVYLAVFPMSLFLQAVYTESLYLALVLAAFYFAERGRWLESWIATGFAVLTRSAGFALVPALALLAWPLPNRWRALSGVLLVPAFFSVFPLTLERQTGDPLDFIHAHDYWSQQLSLAGPLGGLWEGTRDAVSGLGTLVTEGADVRTGIATGSDFEVWMAAWDIQALVFFLAFVPLAVLAWRLFGRAYGLFAVLSLAFPLSTPASASTSITLQSLPRYVMVIFPCFLALAWIGRHPGRHTAIVAISSLLLGVSVVQWALWQWVA